MSEETNPQEALKTEAPPATATVQAPTESSKPTVFLGFTLGEAIFAILWPVALLAGLYAYVLVPRLEAIESGVRSRPAIKVVNVDEVVRAGIASGLQADAAISRADAQFRKLADQGYIVLNNNDVLAAPKETRLP